MEEKLIEIKNEASRLLFSADTAEELEKLRFEFLGKNGKLTQSLKELPKISQDRRPAIGKLANEIKRTIEILFEEREKELRNAKRANSFHFKIDITAPGIKPQIGHLHLVTQAIREITAIFEHIGFERVRYPEVEWDWYAFGALNFPQNHPARDDWETFFIDEKPHEKYGPMLLTPHTSNGQIRQMEETLAKLAIEQKGKGEDISIKMVNIAKTYRRQSDVSHTPMFHQFETLCVGKNISITHLKGVLDYFVKSWFGPERKSRIRPYHFQFTEPSFETDVSCGVCNGTGKVTNEKCRLCKEGWLEMGGAGMVHPNVLRNCGIDPKIYSGFASGWGVERVLMMKEGFSLPDLRMIYSNDLDFLEQF